MKMNNDTIYRSHSALGSTDLKNFIANPRKFWFVKKGLLDEQKKAYDFGNMFHTYLLEPEKFDQRFVMSPFENFRTKAAREWRDAQIDKIIYTVAEIELVKDMAGKCYSLPMFKDLMKSKESKKEVSYFGEIEGVQVKCLIDVLWEVDGGVIVIDPKTTDYECTDKCFSKAIANFGYHFQNWLYEEILKQNGMKVLDFLFLYVSKQPYSSAGLKKIVVQNIEHADTIGRQALIKYKQYVEKYGWDNPWPECEPVSIVSMPNYGYYMQEIDE